MPSFIGSPIEELDTPALLLDKGAMLRNLRRMAEFFTDRKAKLRPHFKNHKCTQLARLQMEAGGAVGITCAKLGEAEAVADAGIGDILIANQVVGSAKLERLAKLAKRTTLRVAVDDEEQIEAISRAARRADATVGLLVEIDIGMGRCGVIPGQPALRLAQKIQQTEGVRFDGLQAYEGHVVYHKDARQREQETRQALELAIRTRKMIQSAGIPVKIVSGGSSSTYQFTGTIDGVDEVQAGSYATMDWVYKELAPEFEIALSVLARVISRPGPRHAVLDVGYKGLGDEFGMPKVKHLQEADIQFRLSEEHCTGRNVPEWRVGAAVELIPSHACTTCNLYREMYVHEQGRVVEIWPIEGSGRLQ
ncbi:MAG TPA: DSD1 family PLP-dependent enzyme [Phycisphaerae bacterium]|nr:DSD1 family PLP-dependent enzyme [Phycisphaerae bacterium]HOQ85887.1 DSD1 family PLP-dependent enzyme [Phycisphaerae bacterium]HPP28009.1 DSD1 family PLP-dependent enzyme [Phycisphaerae bacterium]